MYRILVVDDSRVMRYATVKALAGLGIQSVEVADGEEALATFAAARPDAVLIDVQMPGLDGCEVVRRMRAMAGEAWIPILFLSSMGEDEDLHEAIEAGGDDYLTKPVSPVVLDAKIRALRRLDDMRRQLARATAELREANERLARLSHEDGLTGLANRRSFDIDLLRELGRARREKSAIALVMADVDHFKAYNDLYGHAQGDDCLRRVAQALRLACRRPLDVAARYGGEEFALILPDTSEEGVRQVAQSARLAIRALALPHAGSRTAPHVTASFGYCHLHPGVDTVTDQLVERADLALYEAKHAGRDRVAGWMPACAEAQAEARARSALRLARH